MNDYAKVNYSNITIYDQNPLKRILQNKRLDHGIRELKVLPSDYQGKILDFGAGDGELCKRISEKFCKAEIVCYEPSKNLRAQAKENTAGIDQITVADRIDHHSKAYFDYIFCLEVCEHLPNEQLDQELIRIKRLAKPEAVVIIGIPNEIYAAALIKGVLRLKRRYGEEDARIGNILRAALGFPPGKRPVINFDGLPYILRHMGFDHRKFKKQLQKHFSIIKSYGSPNVHLPLVANFEIYFVCRPLE
jgi:SAM-dependent methyltransferase